MANDWMKPIHERMPASLLPHRQDLWLDPDERDPRRPCTRDWRPVQRTSWTAIVNNPHNDGRDLIEALDVQKENE